MSSTDSRHFLVRSVPRGEDQCAVAPLPQFCSSSRYIGHASEVTHGMYIDPPPKQDTRFLWFQNTGAASFRSSPSSVVQAVLLVRRTYRWHIQGAGGRRCELEGSIWEVGSSDGAAPEPIGLRVVILLGWPRSVRVMVVGTFKPDAWLEI